MDLIRDSLKVLPSIAKPFDEGTSHIVIAMRETTENFVYSSKLRVQKEIIDAREDAYQAHWSVRDARINNKQIPASINPDVAQERHCAFNWVIGEDGDDWDDIETNT